MEFEALQAPGGAAEEKPDRRAAPSKSRKRPPRIDLELTPGVQEVLEAAAALPECRGLMRPAIIDKLILTGYSALSHNQWRPPQLHGKRCRWRLPQLKTQR